MPAISGVVCAWHWKAFAGTPYLPGAMIAAVDLLRRTVPTWTLRFKPAPDRPESNTNMAPTNARPCCARVRKGRGIRCGAAGTRCGPTERFWRMHTQS